MRFDMTALTNPQATWDRQHFVIYDRVPQGIAVLTVQHQVRDIESLIADLTPAFHAEVERLKRKI